METVITNLSGLDVLGWKSADLDRMARKPFTIAANWTIAKGPQQILLPGDLNRGQRELVHRLHHLRKRPKYIRRALQRLDLQDWAGGIEVGAFRVHLRSGEAVGALHTSGSTDGITLDDVLKSINGMMRSHDFAMTQIDSLEYFHTHPARNGQIPDPISSDDEEIVFMLKRQLVRWLGEENAPPVHCFAVGDLEGHVFVYHLET